MQLTGFAISLFLVFMSSLLGVRWLDSYSDHYVNCAQKVWSQAKDAKRFEYLKPHVLDVTENMHILRVDGKSCPSLRPEHAQRIRDYLTKE
jgi:hypothetical protein